MQYIVVLLMALLIVLIISRLCAKKSKKGNICIDVAIALITIVIAWYFTPFHYHIPDDYSGSKITVYTKQKDFLVIEDEMYKEQIIDGVSNLTLRRRFFNGYEPMKLDSYEYLYVIIYIYLEDGSEQQIFLHLTMNESGFVYGSGFGFDGDYNKILNPNDLINYVKQNVIEVTSKQNK